MINRAAEFKNKLNNEIIFVDGAMGTQLQIMGLKLGENPEIFACENPDVIKTIHKKYIDAGANILTTCTFGANSLKLKGEKYSVGEVIKNAVTLAKEVAQNNAFVALDVGPLGVLLSPMGTLSFEEAYDLFKEQVIAGENAGADLIIIETMTDLKEVKAAVLAAKENTSLPVICTMSFESDGRTFMGCKAEAMALVLENLADAIGVNCSLGPKELLNIVKTITEWTNLPVVVQPNAGLPHEENGKTVFDLSPDEFGNYMNEFYKMGATVLGGCCGTTPEHIKHMVNSVKDKPVKRQKFDKAVICSSSKIVEINNVKVIGERINPTGKKLFKQALIENNIDYILKQGIEQAEAGADILDVNVGLPEIDEKEMSVRVISELQTIVDLPLQIDSTKPEVIEAALRTYCGKAIVNSVNGEQKSMDAILPLVKKYNASVVALTLDENGILSKAEDRFKIAEKIVNEAKKYGISKNNIFVDCLTLTVSAQQEDASETLKAVNMVKEKLGVKTVLGVSNISFGLPKRDIINEIFLAEALSAGLDLPIINPNAEGMMKVIDAHKVLSYIDKGSVQYIKKYADKPAEDEIKKTKKQPDSIINIIIKGLKSEARDATNELLKTCSEMDIVNTHLIPALDIVGEKYEKGELFLPQLIQSAETVKEAFEVLKERISKTNINITKGTVILATVKGDIHDIGKNIVKVVLENYGYKIIDLGRDVAPEKVIEAIKKYNVKLVGLSALMTTTVKSMEDTIKLIKSEFDDVITFVGGAVLTADYAKNINADYYAKDAKQSAEIVKSILG